MSLVRRPPRSSSVCGNRYNQRSLYSHYLTPCNTISTAEYPALTAARTHTHTYTLSKISPFQLPLSPKSARRPIRHVFTLYFCIYCIALYCIVLPAWRINFIITMIDWLIDWMNTYATFDFPQLINNKINQRRPEGSKFIHVSQLLKQ